MQDEEQSAHCASPLACSQALSEELKLRVLDVVARYRELGCVDIPVSASKAEGGRARGYRVRFLTWGTQLYLPSFQRALQRRPSLSSSVHPPPDLAHASVSRCPSSALNYIIMQLTSLGALLLCPSPRRFRSCLSLRSPRPLATTSPHSSWAARSGNSQKQQHQNPRTTWHAARQAAQAGCPPVCYAPASRVGVGVNLTRERGRVGQYRGKVKGCEGERTSAC